MDDAQRAQLIRKGNEAFNNENITLATKIFKATKYKSGLERLGDYWMEKEKPLVAYGYYQKAGNKNMLDRLGGHFSFAFKCWLSVDGELPNPKDASQQDDRTHLLQEEIKELCEDDLEPIIKIKREI